MPRLSRRSSTNATEEDLDPQENSPPDVDKQQSIAAGRSRKVLLARAGFEYPIILGRSTNGVFTGFRHRTVYEACITRSAVRAIMLLACVLFLFWRFVLRSTSLSMLEFSG